MFFYHYKCGLSAKQYVNPHHLAFGEEAQSSRTVYNWFAQFQDTPFLVTVTSFVKIVHSLTSVAATNVSAE